MSKNFNNINTKKTVVYPPVGIANITRDLADLVKPRVSPSIKTINIHSSAQPNSFPHLGTLTILMSAFAFGKHLKETLNFPVNLKFEYDNNSPAEKIEVDGVTYSKMQIQHEVEGTRCDKHFIKEFEYLFNYLVEKSGVQYHGRTFEDFQKVPFVRQKLIEIIKNDAFKSIVSPSENSLHIRFPCPQCGYADKSGVFFSHKEIDDKLQLKSKCFEHVDTEMILDTNATAFVDFNTPLMDIIQGALFIEDDNKENAISIMYDGGDWSGVWGTNVLESGLYELGYKQPEYPLHFYAPIIEDWSGAKFSKSMYIKGDDYSNIPEELLNFKKFKDTFGNKGLDVLWEEVVD